LYDALPQIAAGNKDVDKLAREMLVDLRSYAEGFRKFDPARAEVVLLIVGAVQQLLPGALKGDLESALQMLRKVPGQVEPLIAKYPDSPDVRRMVELAAHFQTDPDKALRWMSAPLSPALAKDVMLQRSRMSGWMDLVIAWERADQLPALADAIQAMDEPEGDKLRSRLFATMLTLKYNGTGDKAAGEQAAAMFAELAKEGTAEQRGAARNNLAVLQVALGKLQEGIDLLNELMSIEETAKPAILNLAAVGLTVEGSQRQELGEAFTLVARDAKTAALRLQALAWKHVQAQRGMGDVEETRKEFLAAVKSERKSDFRGTTPLARWGVISTGNFQVSFFYSTVQGFQIRNELSSTLWFIIPAPAVDLLLKEGEAKPAKTKQAAKK
jgi:hypothetical protein